MAQQSGPRADPRPPWTRQRVLRAAIDLADQDGIESLSMRKLSQQLGGAPMSLYNHIANKDDLLDGMIDAVFSEIELPSGEDSWKMAMRQRAISIRTVLSRHRWAIGLMVCVTIVASPIAWSHYLVLTLIPVGCITRWLIDHRFPVRQTNQALVVAVLLLLSWPVWNYLALLACGYTVEPAWDELAGYVQWYVLRRGPALSVGALAWLVIDLGRRDRA